MANSINPDSQIKGWFNVPLGAAPKDEINLETAKKYLSPTIGRSVQEIRTAGVRKSLIEFFRNIKQSAFKKLERLQHRWKEREWYNNKSVCELVSKGINSLDKLIKEETFTYPDIHYIDLRIKELKEICTLLRTSNVDELKIEPIEKSLARLQADLKNKDKELVGKKAALHKELKECHEKKGESPKTLDAELKTVKNLKKKIKTKHALKEPKMELQESIGFPGADVGPKTPDKVEQLTLDQFANLSPKKKTNTMLQVFEEGVKINPDRLNLVLQELQKRIQNPAETFPLTRLCSSKELNRIALISESSELQVEPLFIWQLLQFLVTIPENKQIKLLGLILKDLKQDNLPLSGDGKIVVVEDAETIKPEIENKPDSPASTALIPFTSLTINEFAKLSLKKKVNAALQLFEEGLKLNPDRLNLILKLLQKRIQSKLRDPSFPLIMMYSSDDLKRIELISESLKSWKSQEEPISLPLLLQVLVNMSPTQLTKQFDLLLSDLKKPKKLKAPENILVISPSKTSQSKPDIKPVIFSDIFTGVISPTEPEIKPFIFSGDAFSDASTSVASPLTIPTSSQPEPESKPLIFSEPFIFSDVSTSSTSPLRLPTSARKLLPQESAIPQEDFTKSPSRKMYKSRRQKDKNTMSSSAHRQNLEDTMAKKEQDHEMFKLNATESLYFAVKKLHEELRDEGFRFPLDKDGTNFEVLGPQSKDSAAVLKIADAILASIEGTLVGTDYAIWNEDNTNVIIDDKYPKIKKAYENLNAKWRQLKQIASGARSSSEKFSEQMQKNQAKIRKKRIRAMNDAYLTLRNKVDMIQGKLNVKFNLSRPSKVDVEEIENELVNFEFAKWNENHTKVIIDENRFPDLKEAFEALYTLGDRILEIDSRPIITAKKRLGRTFEDKTSSLDNEQVKQAKIRKERIIAMFDTFEKLYKKVVLLQKKMKVDFELSIDHTDAIFDNADEILQKIENKLVVFEFAQWNEDKTRVVIDEKRFPKLKKVYENFHRQYDIIQKASPMTKSRTHMEITPAVEEQAKIRKEKIKLLYQWIESLNHFLKPYNRILGMNIDDSTTFDTLQNLNTIQEKLVELGIGVWDNEEKTYIIINEHFPDLKVAYEAVIFLISELSQTR